MKDGFQDLMYQDENDERVRQAHLSGGKKADAMIDHEGKWVMDKFQGMGKGNNAED